MKKFIFAIVISLANEAVSAIPVCNGCSPEAVQLATRLAAQGALCDFPPIISVQRGFHCQIHVGGYSLPIDFFISPALNLATTPALAYHLHGWWEDLRGTPYDGSEGDFGSFVATSKQNLIMIVPEAHGKNDTYAQELNTPTRMNQLVSGIEQTLSKAGLPIDARTNRLLSGHSGAYVQLGKIGDWLADGQLPTLPGLKGVCLLDTAYGYRSGLVHMMDYMCKSTRPVYVLAYNPANSAAKAATNQQLGRELKTTHACAGALVIEAPDRGSNHIEFPRKYLPAFYATSLSH